MKRKISYLLSLILLLTLTVACNNSQENSETKVEESEVTKEDATDSTKVEATSENPASSENSTLRMLVPGYESGYMKDELDKIIGAFEDENPGVQVEILSAGWDELNSKIVQLYQAGDAPDIMLMG